MSIYYRLLKPADRLPYRAIRLESLQAYPGSFCARYEEQSLLPRLAFENYIAEEIRDKFIVGAFDKQQLVGICGFSRESEVSGEIIQMYVQSHYQGQKIGQKLLAATIEEARQLEGLEELTLGVMIGSTPARRLYEQAGFVDNEAAQALQSSVPQRMHLKLQPSQA